MKLGNVQKVIISTIMFSSPSLAKYYEDPCSKIEDISAITETNEITVDKPIEQNNKLNGKKLQHADVFINDTDTFQKVSIALSESNVWVDIQTLAGHLKYVKFAPINFDYLKGVTLQYGKHISFLSKGKNDAIISAQKVPLDAQAFYELDKYWVPISFIEKSIHGKLELVHPSKRNEKWQLKLTYEAPGVIGSQVSEAKPIAKILEASGFLVNQGEISLTNAIDIFSSGYASSANGNNADAAYLVTQIPKSPRTDSYYQIPLLTNLDQDEAIIWVGLTPPNSKYFSYQSYLTYRANSSVKPYSYSKIFARLSDSVNNFSLRKENNNNIYNTFKILIFSANKETKRKILKSLKTLGFDDEIEYLDIPSYTSSRKGNNIPVNFGNDKTSDAFNFLHRVTFFKNQDEEKKYLTNIPLEILRITPKLPISKHPFTPSEDRIRITGLKEKNDDELKKLIKELRREIIKSHKNQYDYYYELGSTPWLYPGGAHAIESGLDVLGETNDALYLKSQSFIFNDNDLIIAYGVNHSQTGKSVYSNISLYGEKYKNGIGGINSLKNTKNSYFGSAKEYITYKNPRINDIYAYKFAREEVIIDHNLRFTHIIENSKDVSFLGFKDKEKVFVGFRSYIDKLTGLGPYPGNVKSGAYFNYLGPDDSEVFFDQVIVFSNKKKDIDTIQ
ncbi:hypothetical protein PO80_15825 [Vibrio parahaemolyticus]|uniref:hypothetical protein n=4 Tax=Vibrio TaxID=662 RepID=UPI0005429A3A|nr:MULTISPECIES: hypothetical protein [Vibrio harveyi group]EIZ0307867.1 hypothetical protein [Vibrio parahaemolyticus]EJE8515521.1 hypothetical protein [Vibrio parahaemolyticus]EJE8774350.1 hypothetical protein [Vibrio parahaemolyticus]KHF13851.1 hypothetical protein PO80_15825 [Vibrio parahaemolyticus]OCH68031.1 hypothetical protein A6E00_22930 [Vibrio diabolicus]